MSAAHEDTSPAPEPLAIRGAPRPVKRFSKTALALVMGVGSLVVIGSFAIAMRPPSANDTAAPRELYNTQTKPTADGLASLPASYADVKPAAPELGPPLQGDLGATMLKAQAGALERDDPLERAPAGGSREAAKREAETLIREAQLTESARTSGVFFTIDAKPLADTAVPPSRASYERRDPFEHLAALAAGGLPGSGNTFGSDPNAQGHKEEFAAVSETDGIYNPYRLQTPASPYQLMAGTIIPATLLTGINSDLPGQVIAQVSEPVYDTVTGETLLLPQGARVIGRYDSVIAYGQSRALIVWSRIILPDGSSIRIDNLPAADALGFSGLADKVDNHSWQLAKGIALSTLLGIGAELARDDSDTLGRAIQDAVQTGTNQAGEKIVQRQLDVQPTLTIRPGWRLRIIVGKDIILRPYEGG